eukprot:gene17589-19342_t
MSLVIAPVSYKRLLTTISQQLRIDEDITNNSNNINNSTRKTASQASSAMKDVFSSSITADIDNFLIEHSYVSKKTNFLDILDEETLLHLAYELGLDKKSDLPELKDIDISIDIYGQGIRPDGNAVFMEKDAEKMIQR